MFRPIIRFTRLLLIISCWLLFSSNLQAQQQNPRFDHISTEQGLSQSSIFQIAQDQQGYLWFGTDDGLNRFDGYNFLIFKNNPYDQTSLSSGRATALLVDRGGRLWVGTEDAGLNRYNPQTRHFINYRNQPQEANSLSDNNVRAIREDSNGKLWIGTDNGLNSFDPVSEKFTVYHNDPKNPASLINNKVIYLYLDQKGTLWIGTVGGLDYYNVETDSFSHYRNNPTDPSSLSNNKINAIYQDHAGNYWIGTDNGLNLFDRASEKFTSYFHDPSNANSLSSNFISAIYQDSSNSLWIGTANGLNRWLPEQQSFISYHNNQNDPASLSANRISAIFEDRSGALWFGTYFGGLNRYDRQGNKFISYHSNANDPSSLSNNIVWSICQDHTGVIWVGTGRGGLNRLDPGQQQFRHYPISTSGAHTFFSDTVWEVFEDRAGTIWVGSDLGLARYDRDSDSFSYYQHDDKRPDSLSDNRVNYIYQDDRGTLWIATKEGLDRFDQETGKFINYHHDASRVDSLSNNKIDSIVQDQQGRFWISTGAGLNIFDRDSGRFSKFMLGQSELIKFNEANFGSLYIDHDILWLGSENGLYRVDLVQHQATLFSEKDGLSNNTICAMLPDREGNLWLSTNNGLNRFDPKSQTFKVFGPRDGLQGYEFNGRAGFVNQNGEMFFGGTNGFSRFFPAQIKDNSYQPPVVITGLKLFNKPFAKANPWLNQSAAADQKLTLAYNQNFLSFEFAALNYQLPEKNLYAYKLEGIDQDWILAGTRRFVNYSDLAPGDYTFRVKAANNDGVWNEQDASIRILIVPPLWRTGWAYCCYILMMITLLYGMVKYRLRILQQRNLQLEVKVKQRTTELADALNQIKAQNQALASAKKALEINNLELDKKNQQLDEKVAELLVSQQQADRIFSALAEALPGTVLDGKYRLDEKIGAGGFGAVYRATHLAMKRSIAVKVFRPSPGNDSAEGLERFQLEGISASRIDHPNAINVFDSGISADGIAYLAMELLQGHTLKDELRKCRKLSVERTVEIIWPVCNVLAHAHSLGIVHRDIKPDNIFLHQSSQGEIVKVVDFGIAKLFDQNLNHDFSQITNTGGLIGTPTYMAPERLLGKPYDGRSDVYSVGVMLYLMLSGKVPFSSEQSGFTGVILKHLTEQPPSLREQNSELPEALDLLVNYALAKDQNQRPTAQELADSLVAAFGDRSRVSDSGRFKFNPQMFENLPESAIETISNIKVNTIDDHGAETVIVKNPTH